MVKKLINSLREYKKSTILTPICLIVEVLMECSIPFILAKLIDEGISQGDRNVILKLGLLLLVAAFLSLFFGSTRRKIRSNCISWICKKFKTRYV